MNDKQKFIILIILIVCNLMYFWGPRYKIYRPDDKPTNYVMTYRGSPGYKNFAGKEYIMWDKTLIVLASTLALGFLFIFLLRDKDKPKNDKQKDPLRRT